MLRLDNRHTSVTGGLARRLQFYGLLVFALAVASPSLAQPSRAQDLCRAMTYAGARYVVCTIDLKRYALKLFLKAPDGEPYGSFGRLTAKEKGILFAMNAGMYHEDRSPVGLYVEDGRELKAASTRSGPGNFHLKPNGVFYASGTSAGVLETARYLKVKPRAEVATQSGPMLVIDGRMHPKFAEDSTSFKIRNGVGVQGQSTAVFAISEDPVSFAAFAHLFRDELKCRNALFLDGSISSLYAPSLNRADSLRPMGPIIAAVERRK